MSEIVGLSLFANVGVAEAYFEEIGIEMAIANELLSDRAKFYQELYPKTEMICGDITNEETRNKIVDKAKTKKVNFVIATPPCQGMSIAGNRDPLDERNQLIFYAIDVIKRVKPDYILLENVPRLLVSKIKVNDELILIPDYIKNELGERYIFNSDVIAKAKEYGIPQMRERNIFLLVKKGKGFVWEFPKQKSEVVTLKEAIGHLPPVDPILREGLDFTIDKFPNFVKRKEQAEQISKWHTPPLHSWKLVEWMMNTPTGTSAIFNKIHFPRKDNGDRIVAHHNHYRRLGWDKPSRTITQNNGVISSLCCVHPGREYTQDGVTLYSDPRVLTIYEILIVSSLPKDWNIPSWASDSLIRKVIGEGIPPLLIKKIMLELLRNTREKESENEQKTCNAQT